MIPCGMSELWAVLGFEFDILICGGVLFNGRCMKCCLFDEGMLSGSTDIVEVEDTKCGMFVLCIWAGERELIVVNANTVPLSWVSSQ